MNVGQLRIILDHVPDDLEVVVYASGIGTPNDVRRCPTTRRGRPGTLILSRYHWWNNDADDFRLSGIFRRRAELLRRLDPDIPEGGPTP